MDKHIDYALSEIQKCFKKASDRLWACKTVEEVEEVYGRAIGRNTSSPRTVSNI